MKLKDNGASLQQFLDEPSGKAERERLTGIGKGVIHRLWGAGH